MTGSEECGWLDRWMRQWAGWGAGSVKKSENREESFLPVEITGAWLAAEKEIGEDLSGVLCAGAEESV
jgi:hypothetical protein